MANPEPIIKYEIESISEPGETDIKPIVKTESSNDFNIKSEHDWVYPPDSEQAETMLDPSLSIVKSEYEFQSSLMHWTIDELDCSEDEVDEDEVYTEGDADEDDNDYKDTYCGYNDDVDIKPNISEPLNTDETTKPIDTRKALKAEARDRYFFNEKKRNFFEPYFLRACPYCGIDFESVTEWDTHLNDVHNHKDKIKVIYNFSDRVSCNECKTILSNDRIVLKTHILLHLPHTNIFKCKLCSYVNSRHLLLPSHIERKHFDVVGDGLSALMETKSYHTCPYCSKYVGIKHMLTTHLQKEHGEICDHKVLYVCPYCGEKFADEKQQKEHLENVHQFKTHAGLFFETIEAQKSNLSQVKYKCLKCNALLAANSRISDLIVHALKHLPYKCFKCRYCEYENAFKAQVIKHTCPDLLLDMKNNPLPTAKTTSQLNIRHRRKIDVTNKLHVCPKCGENFGQQAMWEAHLVQVHNFDKYESLNIETTTSPDGESKVTSCTICKKIFAKPNWFYFKQHAFTHMPYKIYKCKQCPKTMNSLFACDCQVKSGKGKLYPISFVCPACGRDFNKEYNWNRHMITMHDLCEPNGLNFLKISDTEITPNYKCSDCGAVIEETSTSSTDILFKHATIEHMLFKCYKCSKCGEQSDSKSLMIEHINQCFDQTELKNSEVYNERKNKKRRKSRKRILSSTGVAVEEIVVKKERQCDNKTEDSNNRSELSICAENEAPSKPKKRIRKKLTVQEKKEKKEEIEKRKTVKLETQADPKPKKTVELETPAEPLQVGTSMGISCPKSFALNKYCKYISYACPECNIPFATSEAWNTHITTEHDFFAENRLNITAIPGVNQKATCSDCSGTVYGSRLHWQRHKLTHMPHQAFVCNICIHRTKTLNVLFDHIQRRHLTPGEFKCIFCDVIFTTFYERYEHIKLQHSDVELKNVCKICSKRFEGSSYKGHMSIHEFNRELIDCGYCERKYGRNRDRLEHWKQKHPEALQQLDQDGKESVLPEMKLKTETTKNKKLRGNLQKKEKQNRKKKKYKESSDERSSDSGSHS